MTDNVGALLRERSLPRRTTVRVRPAGSDAPAREVRTGTTVEELLPATVDGAPVVAALVDHKAVSLATPLSADAEIAPLSAAHWEGERVVRTSAALLALETARAVAPGVALRVEASMGPMLWLAATGEHDGARVTELAALAGLLDGGMRDAVARDVVFRREVWTVAEAVSHFRERGWDSAADLLATAREDVVPLVSCGQVNALALGPTVARASLLAGCRVVATDVGLVLLTSPEGAAVGELSRWAEVMAEHERWQRSLGVTTVGAFNRACVEGGARETIRVAEGFHEKRLSRIADAVAAREKLRVVFVAGPSSSGKTTFIKRLRVQLQVNGLRPLELSLDDYYKDREKTPRDASGAYDFEALEALDLPLLRAHLARLLAGERVRVARYDFLTGTSQPEGGRELELAPGTVLLVEGIHGLNPALLGDAVPRERAYRVFLQPMTSLRFDRLSRLDPSDLRLLRRIVRDRHTRGTNAEANILRWPSVRAGERKHIFPTIAEADAILDTALVYEISVLKTYAERYLLEVPLASPARPTAARLRDLIDRFVAIHADHVPPTSILREFIGESGFEY
jgi:uridine kinase